MNPALGHARLARRLLLVLGVMLLAYAAFLVFNIADPFPHFWDIVYLWSEFLAAAICLLRAFSSEEERRGWILLAVGLACFGFGDVYWTFILKTEDHIPLPSPADAGYLLFYPFVYAALVFLVRAREDRFTPACGWRASSARSRSLRSALPCCRSRSSRARAARRRKWRRASLTRSRTSSCSRWSSGFSS